MKERLRNHLSEVGESFDYLRSDVRNCRLIHKFAKTGRYPTGCCGFNMSIAV